MPVDYYSKMFYIGDGSTETYSIPFPYFNRADIKVNINNEDREFIFESESVIRIQPAPALDEVIIIRRETPRDRIIDFQDGSVLNSATLDRDSNQMMFLVQEATDDLRGTISTDKDGNFDAKGRRIKNVGDPLEPNDIMNKGTTDEYLETFETIKGDILTTHESVNYIAAGVDETEVTVRQYHDDFKNQYITAFVLSGGDSSSLFGEEDYKIDGGDSDMLLSQILQDN